MTSGHCRRCHPPSVNSRMFRWRDTSEAIDRERVTTLRLALSRRSRGSWRATSKTVVPVSSRTLSPWEIRGARRSPQRLLHLDVVQHPGLEDQGLTGPALAWAPPCTRSIRACFSRYSRSRRIETSERSNCLQSSATLTQRESEAVATVRRTGAAATWGVRAHRASGLSLNDQERVKRMKASLANRFAPPAPVSRPTYGPRAPADSPQ